MGKFNSKVEKLESRTVSRNGLCSKFEGTQYFETTVTNQHLILEDIKRRLNPGNSCYHSVENLLYSRLLSKIVKIIIYKTIILPAVLYGSLTLREEHRLKVFGKTVLSRLFGPKRDEVIGGQRKLHNAEFYNFYSSPSIITTIKPRRVRCAGHVARMGEYECVEGSGGKARRKTGSKT
jgi:hypothetical protein